MLFIPVLLLHVLLVVGKYALIQVKRGGQLEDAAQESSRLRHIGEKSAEVLSAAQFSIWVTAVIMAAAEGVFALSIADISVRYLPNEYMAVFLWPELAAGSVFLFFLWLHWSLAELVPQSVGVQAAEREWKRTADLLYWNELLLRPVVFAGRKLGQWMLRGFSLSLADETERVHSEEELRVLVNASHEGGEIDQMESELIDNVFDFSETLAKEVMIPRQKMVCLDVMDSLQENMEVVLHSKHTRYPLCSGDKDHIIGLVHVKDLLEDSLSENPNLEIIKKEILMVPEIMRVSVLLQMMKRKRVYLAVVVDEYGGTVGLVGLEDILEELVGDIQNEHDQEAPEIVKYTNGSFEFDGTVLIEDVEELLDIQLEDIEADTIGGYIFNHLGHAPAVGEEAEINGYRFIILQMDGFRISRVKAVLLKKELPEVTQDAT